MKLKPKKRNSHLRKKIKHALQNLAVDIFGYEAKVITNILTYFTRLSKETGIVQDELVVRIFKDRETIRVVIYNQGRCVKEISVQELIRVFMNVTDVLHMEASIIEGIKNFMKAFCGTYTMDIDRLHICIITGSAKVWVKGYDGITPIKDIPLGTLIKHFLR